MWNKKKEEEYPPKPATSPSQAMPSTRDSPTPMPAPPAPSYLTSERGMAVIGKSVVIKGEVLSREDLTVDGEVEGSIELQENRLTVGLHGRVLAGVKARDVVVLGTVQGNVETSDKIEIRKEGRLIGDIRTARVVIEDGAYFKGSIDIIKPEVPKPAPAPKAAPVQTAAPVATPAPTPAAAASPGPRR